VLVIIETVLLLLLLRVLGELRLKGVSPAHQSVQYSDLGGLAVGEQAPSFAARDQTGKEVKLEDVQGYRMLVFLEPGCSACEGAITALNTLMRERPEFTVFAIGGLEQKLNLAYAVEHNAHMPIFTPDFDVGEKLYRVPMVPFDFILDETGLIRARGGVNHFGHIKELLIDASGALSVIR
jgi:peroxiredoxin